MLELCPLVHLILPAVSMTSEHAAKYRDEENEDDDTDNNRDDDDQKLLVFFLRCRGMSQVILASSHCARTGTGTRTRG